MKVIIARAKARDVKPLLLGGEVASGVFAGIVEPLAACDNVKVAMELAARMFDPDDGIDESGDYGVIAVEFNTDRKGRSGETMYDIVQCAPINLVQKLVSDRRAEADRKFGRGGGHGHGPGCGHGGPGRK